MIYNGLTSIIVLDKSRERHVHNSKDVHFEIASRNLIELQFDLKHLGTK